MLSLIEPKIFVEAREDEYWIKAVNEEIDQIEKIKNHELAPRPKEKKCGRNQVPF
jgi:hypothetical protein